MVSRSAMEAILVDSVQNSLRHFMYSNAIFICERLCAEFPSEVCASSCSNTCVVGFLPLCYDVRCNAQNADIFTRVVRGWVRGCKISWGEVTMKRRLSLATFTQLLILIWLVVVSSFTPVLGGVDSDLRGISIIWLCERLCYHSAVILITEKWMARTQLEVTWMRLELGLLTWFELV